MIRFTSIQQSGSQWDGFRHFGFQAQKRFYNDTTIDDVIKTTKIGIDAWSRAGGIATRGVLIDFWEWSKKERKVVRSFHNGRHADKGHQAMCYEIKA